MEPLFFNPHLVEKPWGGEQLTAQYGKSRQSCGESGKKIGESWEISAESEGYSIVRNGEYAGKTLASLHSDFPQLFGDKSSQFPFTVKLIDAKETLSVQLHGKKTASEGDAEQCEAWYIIKAKPGASVVLGADIDTPQELHRAITTNTIKQYLNHLEVHEGDVIYVPTGMLHAIGEGILLFEIRHPDMVTYRAYDWGRGRELNIDECCRFYRGKSSCEKVKPSSDGTQLLPDCNHFSLELIKANEVREQETEPTFLTYTALEEGQIEIDKKVYPYFAGDTFLIPSGSGRFLLRGGILIKARPRINKNGTKIDT